MSWLTKLGLRADRRNKKSGHSLALTIIELNEFNEVLKEKGVEFADSLLEHVLMSVRNNIRGSDIVKRSEQDKIILLLPNTDSSDLSFVINRIKESIEKKQFKGNDFKLKFSISFKEPKDISKYILSDFKPLEKKIALVHST